MFLSKKGRSFQLPVPEKPKTDVKTLVSEANGATYQIYEVPISGWYYGEVKGAGGGGAYKGTAGTGGKTGAAVYLYAGTKVLLWGASIPTTGFPVPTFDWGGRGAYITAGQSGGAGGGAASSGTTDYAVGGGGSGMLFGYPVTPYFVLKNEESQFEMKPYELTDIYSVACVYAAILCGGGGGACSDEGSVRGSGGGGGAWGRGGFMWNNNHTGHYADGVEGPGGDFGQGGASGLWQGSPGGNGGWAILNFTTGEFSYGTGGGGRGDSGYARLYKLG